MIAEIASIIAPVFICTGLGFLWIRLKRPFDNETAADLIANVGTPCLVLSVLPGAQIEGSALAELGIAIASVYVCFAAIGIAALKSARLSLNTYLPSLMFPNTGNMGVPLCLFAFGSQGLALAVVFMAITMTLHFTVGLSIASGEISFKKLSRTPILYALLISLLMIHFGFAMPRWVHNTVEILGGLTFPLMLLALGASLARLRIKGLGRTFWISALRLGMGFGGGVTLAALFGLTGVPRGVFILECSMPAAVFNYLLAEYYKRNAPDVASVVLLSTVLSFITLPFLLGFLLG